MNNTEFSTLIEKFNTIDTEAKRLASEAKVLSEQIKEEFNRRNVLSFVTANNVEGKLITATTISFDETKLVEWLKQNNKQYLIKEVPITDAVKAELKSNIINESALGDIKKESITKRLTVGVIKG